MSAIESLLNRLEEKMTPAELVRNDFTCAAASCCGFLSSQQFSVGVVLQVSSQSCHNEEEKLRRKLSELAGNLSDKGPSSDDEAGKKPFSLGRGQAGVRGSGPAVALDSLKDKDLSSSSDELPTEAQKVRRHSVDCHGNCAASGNLDLSEPGPVKMMFLTLNQTHTHV